MIALSCWTLNFKCILKPWTCIPLPSLLLFLMSYFTSDCLVYSLTAYCGYRQFYYFCLLTSLLALCVDDFLPLLYVCLYQCNFSFYNFLVYSCDLLSFSLWEVPLTFFAKLGLVVLNCFSFCLSVMLLIFSWNLNKSLAVYSSL